MRAGVRAGHPARRGPGPGDGADRRDGGAAGHAEGIEGLPLFVVNAVRGVVPVATIDGRAVPGSRELHALAAVSGLDPALTRIFSRARNGARAPVVVVAQSVRAPDCGSGGCGFNSRQPPW